MPVAALAIRSQPEAFEVSELLELERDDGGPHDALFIEKTGSNTDWLARQLAAYAGVRAADVGYAGLKDRHAVARQWFSVPRSPGRAVDWNGLTVEGARILEIARTRRKLRRGANRGNAFRIVLEGADAASCRADLEARLAALGERGAPNYFGPQRFGRGAGNLGLARKLFGGGRLSRAHRGFALSAARALVFNAILDRRVRDGSWERIADGEIVNLDGSGSVFAADPGDGEIDARARALDVHPTGTLWGSGAPLGRGAVAALEREAAAAHGEFAAGLERHAEASSRPLRVRVDGLRREFGDAGLTVWFSLPAGAFATVVLREIARVDDVSAGAGDAQRRASST